MGLLRRPDGPRLRDSSVQPFVLADMGTDYLQQTPIAALKHHGIVELQRLRRHDRTAGFAAAFPRGTEVCYSVREKEKSRMRPISLLLALAALVATAHAEGMMNDVSVNFCYGKVMPPCYKWNGPRLELPPRAITAYASHKGWFSSVYPIPFVVPSEAVWGLGALCRAGSLLPAHSISGSVRVTRPLVLDPRPTLPDPLHSMCPQLPGMFLLMFRARSQEPLHGLAAVAGPAPQQGSGAGTLSFDMDRYLVTTCR